MSYLRSRRFQRMIMVDVYSSEKVDEPATCTNFLLLRCVDRP